MTDSDGSGQKQPLADRDCSQVLPPLPTREAPDMTTDIDRDDFRAEAHAEAEAFLTPPSRTYFRTRTPNGTAVTIRQDGDSFLIAVGRADRIRCGTEAATALLAVLADRLGVKTTGLPDWAANLEIEVSDR
jgi:hypothetical protein